MRSLNAYRESFRHLLAAAACMWLSLILLGAASAHSYLVRASGSQSLQHRLTDILRERFQAFDRNSKVEMLPGVSLRICTGVPSVVVRRLLAPGVLTIKAFPSGSRYRSRGARIIERVRVGTDITGLPAVFFRAANDLLFRKFTEAHVNEMLAFYLDGRLLQEGRITGPLSGESELVGNSITRRDAQIIAALLSTAPLPSPVASLDLRKPCDS